MRRVIGRVGRDVRIESIVVNVDGRLAQQYRLVGGPDHGRQFPSLAAVGQYVLGQEDHGRGDGADGFRLIT